MNSNHNNKKKNNSFIVYWEKKRTNKLKYALLQSLYFTIPFSIIFQSIENINGILSLQFGVKFITIFCVYFLLSYYLAFKIYEKKYQKLIKDPQNFDH